LGYNHETSQEEMVDILAHSVKSNNNDWYELELEDGKTITLTGNHKVYLPELDCYRRVEDLKGDEVFLLSKGG
jgi:intein/homing endonuclease